jgi:hypothetical protein
MGEGWRDVVAAPLGLFETIAAMWCEQWLADRNRRAAA